MQPTTPTELASLMDSLALPGQTLTLIPPDKTGGEDPYISVGYLTKEEGLVWRAEECVCKVLGDSAHWRTVAQETFPTRVEALAWAIGKGYSLILGIGA